MFMNKITIYTIILPIVLFLLSIVGMYFKSSDDFISLAAGIISSAVIYYFIVFGAVSFSNFGLLKKAKISIATPLAIFLLLGAYDLISPPRSFGIGPSTIFLLSPGASVSGIIDDIRSRNYREAAFANTPDICVTDLKALAQNEYVDFEPKALAKDTDGKIILLSSVSGVNSAVTRVTRLLDDGSIDPAATFNNSGCFGGKYDVLSLDSSGRMLLYEDIEFHYSDDYPNLYRLEIFDPKIDKTVKLNQPLAGADKDITLIHPQFGPGDKIYAIALTVINKNYDSPQVELVTLKQKDSYDLSSVLNLGDILKQYGEIIPTDFRITRQGELKLYADSKVYNISIADKKVVVDATVGNSDLEHNIRWSSTHASRNFSFGAAGIFTASDQAVDTFNRLRRDIIFNAGLTMQNGDMIVAGIVTGSAKSPVAAWQRATLIKIKNDGSIDPSFGLK